MRFVPLDAAEQSVTQFRFVPLDQPAPAKEPQVIDRAPEEFPPGIASSSPMRLPRDFSIPVETPPVAGLQPVQETEPILPPEASISSFVKGREPELTEYTPTLMQRIAELLPSNRARALNEYIARQIARERGIPIEQVYTEAGGARPIFNPEGRPPVTAAVEAAEVVAKEIPEIPAGAATAALRAYRAGEIPVADQSWVDRAITAMNPERQGKPDPNYQAFQGLGPSIGFSLANLVASVVAGSAATTVTGGNPVAGVAAGMAASGTVAYRASKDEFLERVKKKLDKESTNLYGKPLGKDDWEAAKEEFDSAATQYGLWEAIPEAVSNAIFLKAFSGPAKGMSQSMLASVGQKAGALAAEQATETVTALGQNAAERKAKLTEQELSVADAFRQQFVQTLLTSGVMAGGMKGKELATDFYRTYVEPRVDPASALGRAIQADIEAVAFSPEAIQREAAFLMATGARPQGLAELARAVAIPPATPEEPEAPEAPEAPVVRAEPTLPEVTPEAPGRAEPTLETEPTVDGQAEPTLPAEEEPVVLRPTRRGPPVEEVIEDVPAIPGMPSIEEPSYVFTPIDGGVTPVAPTAETPPAEPLVTPTSAAAAVPVEPTVPTFVKAKETEPEPPNLEAQGLATVEVPLNQLSLSKDVPQFKLGATAKGVVEPLGGKFERTGVAPIQVWRRLDGSLEVISGRHRFDLAQRSGEKTIPAQIHDEAQGFTRDHAAVLDAELNIRDGQGKAKDYVNYFKASGIDRETAESRGLLARATGKRAYTIATQGSDELLAALRADAIPEEAAFYIALNAPNDSRIQAVGINAMNNGKTMNMAVNTMQAVQALAGEQGVTVDMFGLDDSAIREAEAMAKIASRKQRELQTRLSAITGASKNPALAKAEGIDIKDPEAVKRRIEELRQQKAAWENWQTNSDLIAEVRAERGTPPPELQLTGETEAEIRAREEAEQAGATEAEKKRQADLARDMFALEGEAAPTEVKPPEQAGMFEETPVIEPVAEQAVEAPAPEAPAVAPEIERLQKTYDDAKAALDALGPEPPKPRTERQFFGKNGREGADPETVRRYDEGVKKYNSWKRKYGKLKKDEVDASNALFRATQPTKAQVKEETKLVEDTTKAVLEAKLNDFMVGDQVRFGNTPGVVIGLEGDYVRFRPDAARSPKAYQRVPKTSLTMVARPDTTSEVSYSKGQDSKFGEEAGQLNADMGGLIQLLGANMYASNLADVTVKELLQNAFDAVKGAVSSKKGPALYKTGSIEIKVDSGTRTISIKDNARGMTPEIVRDAFFTIAGSEKSDLDPSERSGGLGLAKMGFMLGSDRLQLDTVRDGVRIKVDTTAKDIANNNFKIVKSPAPKKEHGTTVTVTIPENYTDPRTGEAKPIWFPWSVRSISPLTKPLIGPVKVDVDINGDKQTLPVGTNFPEDKYQSFKANFDWGSADIYFGIERKSDTWQTNHQVLSSGVYQFDQEFTLNKEKIPYDIIVNVKPNVDAKHPDYPFENSRERFKGRLKNDIGSLTNYLGTIARGYEAAGLQESFKGIVSMPRVEAGADIAGMADKLKKSFGTQGAQAPSELKPLPKEVTITPTEVRDTRTQQVLVDTQKAAEKEKASTFKGEKVKESKDFMIDLKQDPKLPIFHNNTNVDFVEVGRDYGDPEQFFAELGTLMVEMKEDLAKSGIYGYEKLSPDNLFFAGISIDKDYGGVHIKVPYKAVLINPFYDWGARTLFGVRGNILNTMIHEIAHTGSMDHGVAHNGQMIKVEQYLNDEGLMDYYRDAILDVLRRHESTFTAMRDAYGRSTTKNTAKSLEDVQKDAAAASARGDRGRGADEAGTVPAGEGQGRGEGVRATAASRAEGEVGGRPGEAGRVEPADQAERERVDELLDEFNRPKVTGRELETVKSRLMPSTSSIRSTFKEMVDNPSQAVNMIFGPLNRGIAQARNYLFFSGAGLEEADAKRYANQVRTANDEATATLALDNMLHGNGIAVQFLMQGGLRYNPETKRIEAHQADGSMLDVYINERALKNKLGDERGAMLAQGYFEAKRSKNIRDEMAQLAEEIEVQKEALDDARDRLRELKKEKAADSAIDRQQKVVDRLADEYNETKTQLDEIVRINEEKVLMSDEEIEAFIDQDAVYPELRNMMDAWMATNRRLLGMMRQVRMISEKRYKRLMSIKDYVPWQRVQDDDVDIHYVGNPRSATNITKERAFKKGKVERAVAYIPDNMTDNIIRLTQSVLRQYAALRIVDEYATRDPETGKIKTFAKADRNKGRFDYISDGRRVVVEVKDPVIAEAVYGRDSVDLRAPEAIAAATNFMRRAITIDPFFQMSQVIKDAPTAAIVTGVRNPWALMGSVMTSFAKTVVNADPVADILRANGIGGFQAITRTPEAAVKRKKGLVNRSVGAATLELMDHIGDASDFAARIAAYKRTMAETGDEALALYRAANVINFNRLGSSGAIRTFVTYVNFANAYLQSIDTLFTALTARGARGRDTKKALGIMAATVAQLTALTLAYSWLVGGDDEYEKLDDATKVRNFFIPKSVTGTDSGILIPINTSAAFIFKAMPELTYNMFASQATKTPMDATRYKKAVSEAAADAFFGPEPVPSAIRPIIEIAMNRSFFTERPLTPRGTETLEKFQQFTDQTSELGKLLGQAGGLSPIEWDHLIRGTTGVAGMLAQYGSNMIGEYLNVRPESTAKQLPGVGRFIAPEIGRGPEALFYDLHERVRKATATYKDLEATGQYEKAEKFDSEKNLLIDLSREMNRTESKLKKINAEIRMLSRGREEGTAKERRREITELQRDKQELLDGIEMLRKEAGL